MASTASQFFVPLTTTTTTTNNDQSKFAIVDHQWDGYTLVLPCVSVGNVPQLAVDLLIYSLLPSTVENFNNDNDGGGDHVQMYQDLKPVGYILSSNVHPYAGPDPFYFGGSLLATSIQVFVSERKKLVIIQQRSPILSKHRQEFYRELSDFVGRHCFALITILASSFDQYLMPDSDESIPYGQSPIKYILASNIESSMKTILEQKLSLTAVLPVDLETKKPDPNGRIHLPGSGSARAYLREFIKNNENGEKSTKNSTAMDNIVCLVMYCSEGDNRSHAFKLANQVIDLINNNNNTVTQQQQQQQQQQRNQLTSCKETPFSWRALFGDEPPAEIF